MCGRVAQATLERVRASARAGGVACERLRRVAERGAGRARARGATRGARASGDDDDDDDDDDDARAVRRRRRAAGASRANPRREASNREAPPRWDEMAYNARGEGLRRRAIRGARARRGVAVRRVRRWILRVAGRGTAREDGETTVFGATERRPGDGARGLD